MKKILDITSGASGRTYAVSDDVYDLIALFLRSIAKFPTIEGVQKTPASCPQCGTELIMKGAGWGFCDSCVCEIKCAEIGD